jgi:hypothetical protein
VEIDIPEGIIGVLARQRRRLEALLPGQREMLLRLYAKIRADLAEKLATLPPDRYTAQMTRVILAQIEAAGIDLAAAMGAGLVDIGALAAEVGRSGLIEQIDIWADTFEGSVRRISRVEQGAQVLSDSLLEYYDVSRQTYGLEAIGKMKQVMAEGALKGETVAQTAKRIEAAAEIAPYRAERIARTELSNAMHETQAADWRAEFGDEQDEWRKTTTGPMDQRTGDDSRKIEGQVRKVDEAFEGDNGPFQRNPDRPNDRGTTLYLPAYAMGMI